MLTIEDNCGKKFIARAPDSEGLAPVGPLMRGAEDCAACPDRGQLRSRPDAGPQAIIVYNQRADAIALIEGLAIAREQLFSKFGRIPGVFRACRLTSE